MSPSQKTRKTKAAEKHRPSPDQTVRRPFYQQLWRRARQVHELKREDTDEMPAGDARRERMEEPDPPGENGPSSRTCPRHFSWRASSCRQQVARPVPATWPTLYRAPWWFLVAVSPYICARRRSVRPPVSALAVPA